MKIFFLADTVTIILTVRVHKILVFPVYPINFIYVFIEYGPILRHLGEFGKIGSSPGGNKRFFEEDRYGYLMEDFHFFLCRIYLHSILAWSRPMKLNISGDIWILSDFRHLT
jgi:hypothetical protein